MRAHHGAGALAVDVQVTDMELLNGAIDLVTRLGIDGARQAELGVVRDFECLIEATGLNHREHRSEDFFLLEFGFCRNVGNHRGTDKVAFAGRAVAARDQAAVFFALFDVSEDRLHRAFVDDGAHVGVFGGIADLNLLDADFELLQEFVVDALVHDGARAGRALLTLEAKCGLRHAFARRVNVRVGIDNDRVFAAHLENRALDPDLSRSLRRCDFVDVQADFARASEGDEARLGMRHDGVSKAGSGARTEIHHALGHARFFEQLDELRGDGGRIARRLEDDGVATHDRYQRHASHDGARKIPRRNHGAYAQRNVHHRIVLAGQLDGRLRLRKAKRLASVELAEIDGLGNIGVGLSPVLADFKHQPRHEFHLALAHEITDAEHQAGALFHRGTAPRFECLERGGHRWLYVLLAGLLMGADNLRRFRWIQRLDLVGFLDAFASDDEVILVAQLSANLGDS